MSTPPISSPLSIPYNLPYPQSTVSGISQLPSLSSSPSHEEKRLEHFIQNPPASPPHSSLTAVVDIFLRECSPETRKHCFLYLPKGAVPHLPLASGASANALILAAAKQGITFGAKTFNDREDSTYHKIEIKDDEYKIKKILCVSSARGYGQDDVYAAWYKRHTLLNLLTDPMKIIESVAKAMREENVLCLHLTLPLEIAQKVLDKLPSTQNKTNDDRPFMHYQISVDRNQELDKFKQKVESAIKLIREHRTIFSGLVIVGNENSTVAVADYNDQKRFLHELSDDSTKNILLTTSCGEYKSPHGSMQDALSFRSVRLVGGSYPAKNPAMRSIFIKMADKKNPIPLITSFFDWEHQAKESWSDTPLAEYRNHCVPMLISGFSDITGENFADNIRCIWEQEGYVSCKKLIRNSLHHAQLEGQSIFCRNADDTLTFLNPFTGIEGKGWESSLEATAFLEKSQKARLQVELEKQLVTFEEKILKENITVYNSSDREIDPWRLVFGDER